MVQLYSDTSEFMRTNFKSTLTFWGPESAEKMLHCLDGDKHSLICSNTFPVSLFT